MISKVSDTKPSEYNRGYLPIVVLSDGDSLLCFGVFLYLETSVYSFVSAYMNVYDEYVVSNISDWGPMSIESVYNLLKYVHDYHGCNRILDRETTSKVLDAYLDRMGHPK